MRGFTGPTTRYWSNDDVSSELQVRCYWPVKVQGKWSICGWEGYLPMKDILKAVCPRCKVGGRIRLMDHRVFKIAHVVTVR